VRPKILGAQKLREKPKFSLPLFKVTSGNTLCEVSIHGKHKGYDIHLSSSLRGQANAVPCVFDRPISSPKACLEAPGDLLKADG